MSRVRVDRKIAVWWVASILGALGAAPALAQSASLSWHCWVDGGERLSCVLDAMGQGDALATGTSSPAWVSASLSAAQGAWASGDFAAGAPTPARSATVRQLPPIVAQLRDQPRALAGQVIAIPMYSITDDWPRVTQLARAVLCTSAQSCSIRLSTSLNEALSRGLDTDRLFVGPDLGPIGQAALR